MAMIAWVVSVTPAPRDEPDALQRCVAAFPTVERAEWAVKKKLGRNKHVVGLRPLTVGELLHLRLKPGEIRLHG
jgi:hypothetical protein